MAGSNSRDGKCERLLWFCCPRFNLGGHGLAHGALCDVKPDGFTRHGCRKSENR